MVKKLPFARARNQDAKALRRQHIVETGQALFKTAGLDDISMEAIARKSKLAKGTLYLYFSTKEEVFLEVLQQELQQWISQLRQSLQKIQSPLPPRELAQALTSTLKSQPELPRLLGLLHNVLAQNLSEISALKFKLELKKQLTEASEVLVGKTLALNAQNAFPFLMRAYAILVGLYQVAHPSPRMQKVLEHPELQLFQINFEEQLNEILFTLLVGMEEIENQKTKTFHLFKNY